MFTGFTDATVDFLWGIRFNNERPWFEAHKETYLSELYRPMKDLGAEIYDFLSERRPEDAMMCRVSRIYRDARRLHGRGPYKDHLWFCVRTGDQDWTGRPTFYFEIAPDYYSYGMGFWAASAATMTRYRQQIDRDPKTLEKLVRAFNRQEVFQLNGPDYVRSKGQVSDLLRPCPRAGRRQGLLSRQGSRSDGPSLFLYRRRRPHQRPHPGRCVRLGPRYAVGPDRRHLLRRRP